MTIRQIRLGDVLLVSLPRHAPPGPEQLGQRPAVVVGLPELTGPVRFPMTLIAPVTRDQGQGWAEANRRLYPRLPAGTAGLSADSIVLLDQVRAVGIRRIIGQFGTVGPEAYQLIGDGLRRVLELA